MTMRIRYFAFTALALLFMQTTAGAQGFSTSVVSPTPVDPSGLIMGTFPSGGKAVNYYFAADLLKGELLVQISFSGRPNKDKELTFEILDANKRAAHWFYITNGLNANQEEARAYPIDSPGRYTFRVIPNGTEGTEFSVSIGGAAFPSGKPPASRGEFSTSILAPSAVNSSGAITGTFPGGEKQTYYYFNVDLKRGDLMTQISFSGRANTKKMFEFTILDSDKTAGLQSYYIMSGLDANQEATKSFPIDSAGRYTIRLVADGTEGTTFKVELGGAAFATPTR